MQSSTPGDMRPVFGRVTTAMITPFTKDLRMDLEKAAVLALTSSTIWGMTG